MLDKPKTKDEARKYRYFKWGGNPNGNQYAEGYCAMEVWQIGRGMFAYQCSRKNGHGPEGLYCKQHSKKL